MTSPPGTGSTNHYPRARARPRGATDSESGWEREGWRLRAPESHAGTSLPSRCADPRQRLAAEHELLLRDVVARADDVLARLNAARWPEHELAELIRYFQTEVIRQTRMEEQLLFARPGGSSDAKFTRLARDHVRIRYALEALTDAARDRGRRDQRSLAATVHQLVAHLAAHLLHERAVLSRLATDIGWQRALAAMEKRPHAWYPLVHAPVLDLDTFSTSQMIDAVRPRVQRLRPDEQIVLVCRRDLRLLCTYLLRDDNVAVHHLDDGPRTWRVSVRRRRFQ